MASAGKADRKAALDVASWLFNVVTSVGIIMVNKALMATYGFSFVLFASISSRFVDLKDYIMLISILYEWEQCLKQGSDLQSIFLGIMIGTLLGVAVWCQNGWILLLRSIYKLSCLLIAIMDWTIVNVPHC